MLLVFNKTNGEIKMFSVLQTKAGASHHVALALQIISKDSNGTSHAHVRRHAHEPLSYLERLGVSFAEEVPQTSSKLKVKNKLQL